MTVEAYTGETVKLTSAMAAYTESYNPYGEMPENPRTTPGLVLPTSATVAASRTRTQSEYLSELQECRYFYKYDPIASSVINRMCELGVQGMRLRRGQCNDKEMAYYKSTLVMLLKMLRQAAREYLVAGMAIADFTTERKMGKEFDPSLGRTRYVVPRTIFIRNPDNIVLKRMPLSLDRKTYIHITDEEIQFIRTGGQYSDGTKDEEAYKEFAKQYPGYVKRVLEGSADIPLDVQPILRKVMSHDDYPQLYLTAALPPLRHKNRIKQMDYSIATRALEAIRLIKVGSDEFPVTEGDPMLKDLQQKMKEKNAMGMRDLIYTLFANHTVTIEWVYPPLDALLSEGKYSEPNSDIFLALGFSRSLLVGEALRSNASQNGPATLGPLSTLLEMRTDLLEWVNYFFKRLAEMNGFESVPVASFAPISNADLSSLAQFAVEAAKIGAISKDTVAHIFNTSFEEENIQITVETDVTGQPDLFTVAYNKPEPAAPKTVGG